MSGLRRTVEIALLNILHKVYGLAGLDNRKTMQRIVKRARTSLAEKILWDAMPYAYYGYGVYQAALQARALGIGRIAAVEFGVAGGTGLLALEGIARGVREELGVEVAVYGFDTGKGMPPPADYRDLPFIWQPGFFRMDVGRLKGRLDPSTTLVLGDVADTAAGFAESHAPPPVGFVSFDLDYYSSTVHALKLFDAPDRFLLPRVFCYFDDTVGDDWNLHCAYLGELLAVEEFNRDHPDRKLAKIYGFPMKRMIRYGWNEKIFVLHGFQHPDYNRHVHPDKDMQLGLEDDAHTAG